MLTRLRAMMAAATGRNRKTTCRFVPRILELEDRRVLSATTDYTQIAQMFPRHAGPTRLLLNFDGHQGENVAAFQATTGNRERDIQEILFRTAEIFSPFDVQVQRITGNGARVTSGGATTIFVGDDADYGTGVANTVYYHTSFSFVDGPGVNRGFRHVPNSDAFDVAFADPVGFDSRRGQFSESNTQIARGIAHEAGHTFGLAHVVSPAGESVPDTMSYDSSNQRFVDRTLPLTNLNNNGTSTTNDDRVLPQWYVRLPLNIDVPYYLRTQNSFRFLTAVLGSRPADDNASVHNAPSVETFVQPRLFQGPAGTTTLTSRMQGSIERLGDYDVFTYTALRRESVTITVQPPAASVGNLRPEILVYQGGEVPVAFSAAAVGSRTTQFTLQLSANQGFRVVVGGVDGATSGSYSLSFQSVYVRPIQDTRPPVGTVVGGVLAPLTFVATGGLIGTVPTVSPGVRTVGKAPRADAVALTDAALRLAKDKGDVVVRVAARAPAAADEAPLVL